MSPTPLRQTLTALRDHLLAPPSCFERGYAPARADDGYRIWTWDGAEAREVGPADHHGPYFYVRLRSPLRYRAAEPIRACTPALEHLHLPLRLVALAPCTDPLALERWLRRRLHDFRGAELRLLAAEIDPIRAFRLERGPDAPLPEAFHAGRWAILSLDLELQLADDLPPCPDQIPCSGPWPTACAEQSAPVFGLE